jgi:hypothetical protein
LAQNRKGRNRAAELTSEQLRKRREKEKIEWDRRQKIELEAIAARKAYLAKSD